MHETPEDLARLQDLLDRSRAGAGAHLLRIIQEDWRIDAAELAPRLDGVQILHLATVTAKGEPRVGPVDGLFFRGQVHFGTAPDSPRARNTRGPPPRPPAPPHPPPPPPPCPGRSPTGRSSGSSSTAAPSSSTSTL